MSSAPECYVLDANVFIQAKRRFYGFDFCPGFWSAIIAHQQQNRLCSVDRVLTELQAGQDDLAQWASDRLGAAAFSNTAVTAVRGHYEGVVRWVMAQSQFADSARNEFLSVADPWLVAYAKSSERVVVTLEQHDPHVRKKVPIPNLCVALGVPYISPFDMLRRLDVRLTWSSKS